ncbi:hypothetical protein GLAREA_08148 [Glarea lozoyensis ATCC 20868]|uniref:Exosome complex protein n=1 Tax=Glarea lozoyensis (strain ATCC 20868 / MF5171) TaxID=1116229 RepID=S3CCQ0_GLAL2|nr:uncharacterized protein GLAREA_08148 [Glarea lozoyensis ATCC 20868]EPE24297.1 hypothetical protein GLAREA_08148 [Glarea lozoyensis ATCC 20868]
MDSSKVLGLLEQLDDEIDDLEESLAPLIETALSDTTSKLPLVDKAKLYVLVTYAIESMLFSYLRLNGVKARDHPVFIELTRVKQYFDKIKNTEPAAARTMTLDKAAAARFINPSLAAAEKEALKQAEIQARARAKAHIKFDEPTKNADFRSRTQKRQPEEDEAGLAEHTSSSDSDSPSENEEDVQVDQKRTEPPRKKRKTKKTAVSDQTSTPTSGMTSGTSSSAEKSKKSKGKGKSVKQQKIPKKNKAKST